MANPARYPFLRDYLNERSQTPAISRKMEPWLAGILAPGSFFGSIALAMNLGWNIAQATLFAIFVALPLFVFAMGIYMYYASQPKNEKEKREVQLRAWEKKLLNWARRKSRERDPITMGILEIAAESHQKLETSLGKSIWNQKNLDPSWSAWRKKAIETADLALSEAVWVSQDLLKPGVFEAEDPNFTNGIPENLPSQYRLIAKIAGDLSTLANAAANQTEELEAQRHILTGESDLAIETTLADLNSLREAYQELGVAPLSNENIQQKS